MSNASFLGARQCLSVDAQGFKLSFTQCCLENTAEKKLLLRHNRKKCPACLENTVHYIPTVNGPNISNGLAVPQLSYNCRVVVLLCSRIDWEEPCVARRGASTAGLKPVGPIPKPSCKNEGGGKDCLTVLDCENIWVNIVRILLNHSHQSFHWVFFFV